MKLPDYVFASLCLLGCASYPIATSGLYAYNVGSINLGTVPPREDYGASGAGLIEAEAIPATLSLSEPQRKSQPQPLPEYQPEPDLATRQPVIANKARFDPIVAEVALAHGLDSALLHAVISVESRYNPNAVSRAGAVGLMQLMPATAKHYGVTDSFDPTQNVQGGAKYLRDLLIQFDNDINLVLAAYNAGAYAVIRNGNRIPPYPETRSYVPRVMGYYREYRKEL